jgi:hypothetical protein
VSRRGGTGASLLLAVAIGGCSSVPILGDAQPTNDKAIPPIVPIAAGQTAQGPWRALAYRTSDGWTCLEVVGGSGSSSCGMGEGGLLGTSWSSSGGTGDMISGGTDADGATGVNVLLDDGTVVSGSVVPVPPPVAPPGVKAFVVVLPPGRSPTQANIVDADGRTLETNGF